MLHKTRGIVLHQIPYNDSSVIVHIYTEKFGRQSYWLSGAHSRRSSQRSNIFQPLFLVDLEAYHKPHELQKIKEAVNYPLYTSIPFDINKTSLAIFISEVLSRSLKEEEPNPSLFEFLFNSLLTLDLQKDNVSNFHLFFLLKLTRYLGFYPADNFSETNSFFDYHAGMFTESPPLHKQYLDKTLSAHVHFFLSSDYEKCMNYPMNSELRVVILSKLIDYYDFHFDKMGKILSLKILKEVYHF